MMQSTPAFQSLVASFDSGRLVTGLAVVLAFVIGALLIPSSGHADGEGSFLDEFDTLNAATWEPATSLPWYVGVPDVVPVVLDGRSALDLTMHYAANLQRVGYQTRTSFSWTSILAECVFKALGPPNQSIDGLMEIYLFNSTTQNYIVANVHFGTWGNLRQVSFWSNLGPSTTQVLNSTLNYDGWYKLRVEAVASTATLLFYNETTNALLWQTSVPVGLSNLGSSFRICFAQYLGTPGGGNWIAHSALDRIQATSGTTPVESSTWGLVKSTFSN